MKTTRTLTIDCHKADTVLRVHKEIERQLHFPKHYGHNLDALHDCLSEVLIEHVVQLHWEDSTASRKDAGIHAIHALLLTLCRNAV